MCGGREPCGGVVVEGGAGLGDRGCGSAVGGLRCRGLEGRVELFALIRLGEEFQGRVVDAWGRGGWVEDEGWLTG